MENQKDFVIHSGVKGMKWGVWNEETRKRRSKNRKDRTKTNDKQNNGTKHEQEEDRIENNKSNASYKEHVGSVINLGTYVVKTYLSRNPDLDAMPITDLADIVIDGAVDITISKIANRVLR